MAVANLLNLCAYGRLGYTYPILSYHPQCVGTSIGGFHNGGEYLVVLGPGSFTAWVFCRFIGVGSILK